MDTITCTGCGIETDALCVFPGNRCIECYRPEGDRLAAVMTPEMLARMWGGNC